MLQAAPIPHHLSSRVLATLPFPPRYPALTGGAHKLKPLSFGRKLDRRGGGEQRNDAADQHLQAVAQREEEGFSSCVSGCGGVPLQRGRPFRQPLQQSEHIPACRRCGRRFQRQRPRPRRGRGWGEQGCTCCNVKQARRHDNNCHSSSPCQPSGRGLRRTAYRTARRNQLTGGLDELRDTILCLRQLACSKHSRQGALHLHPGQPRPGRHFGPQLTGKSRFTSEGHAGRRDGCRRHMPARARCRRARCRRRSASSAMASLAVQ